MEVCRTHLETHPPRGNEMKNLWIPVLAMAFTLGGSVSAQTPAAASNPAADRSIGEVASVDPQRMQIVLKEDKGSFIVVSFVEKTSLLRIPPGETDVKKATRIAV